MSSKANRQIAFVENTKAIEAFCDKHNLLLEYLNDGYQLRIEHLIDVYPVRMKWHWLETGERGIFKDMAELEALVLEDNKPPVVVTGRREDWPDDQETVKVPEWKALQFGERIILMNGVDPLMYVDLKTDRLYRYQTTKPKWWQFRKMRQWRNQPKTPYSYTYSVKNN